MYTVLAREDPILKKYSQHNVKPFTFEIKREFKPVFAKALAMANFLTSGKSDPDNGITPHTFALKHPDGSTEQRNIGIQFGKHEEDKPVIGFIVGTHEDEPKSLAGAADMLERLKQYKNELQGYEFHFLYGGDEQIGKEFLYELIKRINNNTDPKKAATITATEVEEGYHFTRNGQNSNRVDKKVILHNIAGEIIGTSEQQQHEAIQKALKPCAIVIDLHTTSQVSAPTALLRDRTMEDTQKLLPFLVQLGLKEAEIGPSTKNEPFVFAFQDKINGTFCQTSSGQDSFRFAIEMGQHLDMSREAMEVVNRIFSGIVKHYCHIDVSPELAQPTSPQVINTHTGTRKIYTPASKNAQLGIKPTFIPPIIPPDAALHPYVFLIKNAIDIPSEIQHLLKANNIAIADGNLGNYKKIKEKQALFYTYYYPETGGRVPVVACLPEGVAVDGGELTTLLFRANAITPVTEPTYLGTINTINKSFSVNPLTKETHEIPFVPACYQSQTTLAVAADLGSASGIDVGTRNRC